MANQQWHSYLEQEDAKLSEQINSARMDRLEIEARLKVLLAERDDIRKHTQGEVCRVCESAKAIYQR